MPATARQVWGKQAAHINLKLSQLRGGHPEVSHPPGRPLSGPRQEAGEHLPDVSDLVSIKVLHRVPHHVSAALKNDTQALGRAKSQMLFKVRRFKITTKISLNKHLISFVSA